MNKKKNRRKRANPYGKTNVTMRKKLAGLFLLVVLALICLLIRITYINAVSGDKYTKQVLAQSQSSYSSTVLPFKRGNITDANGTVLAASERTYNVILDCKVVNSADAYASPTVDALVNVFGLDAAEMHAIIANERTRNSQYQVVKKNISIEERQAFYDYINAGSDDSSANDDSTSEDAGSPADESVAGEAMAENGMTTDSPSASDGSGAGSVADGSGASSIADRSGAESIADGSGESEGESLSDEEKDKRKNVKGIWFEEEYVRKYPLGSLACDVIGFTYDGINADWGIEGYYNNTLNGVNGRKFGYWEEGSGKDLQQTIIDPIDGDTVVSTIDINIQQFIEKEIAWFNDLYKDGPYNIGKGAENVGVIVMDPNSGTILGMASSDPYDLNEPRNLSSFVGEQELAAMSDSQKAETLEKLWRNYCTSDLFEPGSTFKPVTVSAALESGVLNGNETFLCDGGEIVSGTRIKCADESGHGELNLQDVIAFSCNDGMMNIASRMGVETFCRYESLFNFGSRTGIDLPGEAAGILYTADTMGSVDLATSSFGQGFECTMIQEAAAIASIVNGGFYYRPRVVGRIMDSSGATKKVYNKVLTSQTISADNSQKLKMYMRAAVDYGTAEYAKVNGYSMGGKTGTAQKIPRADGKYLVSFVGFAPYDDPKVLIYVVIDEPNVSEQADSRFAQWMARDILADVLPYMNIYQDEILKADSAILRSGLDNTSETEVTTDTTADTNVPEVQGNEDAANVAGGNNQETDGYTNEEAGMTEG
ncbi:MAG: penicillin-binding protein 2 [Lachnospiraceae bacterium]|nr:penicillin-binding protein 2 [Lachnospiraceae bacterium]